MYNEFLPFIDVQDGMSRVLNNKKLYAKLLKLYPQNLKLDELDGFLAQGNTAEAQNIAHAIKGVSANLSVKSVYESAKLLEQAIKDGADCKALYENLKTDIGVVLPLINDLIFTLEH